MRSELLQRLAQRIEEIQANERPRVQPTIPVSIAALADALPGHCLPAGSLVEIMSATEGAGAWTLALLLAKEACTEQKVLVIADEQRSFYPPAASRLGIALQRTLVIRPKQREHGLTALV